MRWHVAALITLCGLVPQDVKIKVAVSSQQRLLGCQTVLGATSQHHPAWAQSCIHAVLPIVQTLTWLCIPYIECPAAVVFSRHQMSQHTASPEGAASAQPTDTINW